MEQIIPATYELRFGDTIPFRRKMWQLLCQDFFQQFIPAESTVMEVAAGYCEFINNIKAKRKIAVDINPNTRKHAESSVEVVTALSTDLSAVQSQTVDAIFISNFFEHITKDQIIDTLKECFRCLKVGGQILILQPNIRFAAKDYWMFFDHITPIDDRALVEILTVLGFKVKLNMPKFLPYTTKSKLPKSLILLKLYLKIPLLHRIFGGQAFVVAARTS